MQIIVKGTSNADVTLDSSIFFVKGKEGKHWQFTCTAGGSHKFWSIGIHESAKLNRSSSSIYTVVTFWGPIGAASPQDSTPYTSANLADCEDFVLRKVKEKVKKGYLYDQLADPMATIYNRGPVATYLKNSREPAKPVVYEAGEWDIL